jgi:hypothetical protein
MNVQRVSNWQAWPRSCASAGSTCACCAAVGPASRVIVDAAKKLDADLIIMSTRGRTGLAHVFIGSVAERVVRSAPCPVLTTHPEPDPRRRPRTLDAATPRTAHQA